MIKGSIEDVINEAIEICNSRAIGKSEDSISKAIRDYKEAVLSHSTDKIADAIKNMIDIHRDRNKYNRDDVKRLGSVLFDAMKYNKAHLVVKYYNLINSEYLDLRGLRLVCTAIEQYIIEDTLKLYRIQLYKNDKKLVRDWVRVSEQDLIKYIANGTRVKNLRITVSNEIEVISNQV